MRFYWNVLRSITPVSFPSSGKEKRLARCCISIPRGSGSPLVRSQRPCGYRASLVHFGLARCFAVIPTEYEGTRRTESASWCNALLREPIGLAMLSAGSTLGAARPRLRQGVKCGSRTAASLDSLHLIRRHVRFTLGSRLRFTNLAVTVIPEPTHPRPAVTRVDGRLDRLQFMAGQVVRYPAAASVSGHCPPAPPR